MKALLLFTSILLTACHVSAGNTRDNNGPVLQTIPLEITTTEGDRAEFVEGEEVQFLLSLGAEAYIYMFHVDASGTVEQLLPSEYKSSHFYKKGYFLTVPDYDQGDKKGFRFIVASPFGEEAVWIFASDSSIPVQKNLSISAVMDLIQRSSKQAFAAVSFEMRTRRR